MSATVTLVYTINATGQRTPTQLAALMDSVNVPIPPDALTLLAVSVTSDISAASGTQAVRTIVLDAASAAFLEQFPNDQESPFAGLLTDAIASYVNAPVIETYPAYAP